MSATMAETKVDVFISGAGPVGLLLAYQLTRLGLSVHIIDAADKASPSFPMYGRASTLMPRTLEMMDQLDLYDDLAQVGFAGRRSFTYRDGKAVQGGGWKLFENLDGQTHFAFAMNIRLKYSEDVFRTRLAEMGVKVHAPVKLMDFKLEDDAEDDYKVRAICQNTLEEETRVAAKYIIGADGGNSMVRKLAGIPFMGERHVQHWVRIDGVVKTNVPDSRIGFGAFESKTHGQVLWVSLDNSATRIGYVLSAELFEKYGTKMSAEDAVAEAKKAVAPFELEFNEVHWHTVYGIQQHVAERFQDRERILIAGDAAHTHSSGAAQGMNTGTHDVCALTWRLAGVLKGWYKWEVLTLYSDERRAAAQQLIENDKLVSELISQRIPESLKGLGSDPMKVLYHVLQSQSGFTLGLGISYAPNLLNDVDGSYPPIGPIPGHRAPDAEVFKNGNSRIPTRLFELTKYNGKFHVVIFTGNVTATRSALRSLRSEVDEHSSRFAHAVDFLTIILGVWNAFDEYLGVRRFGNAYWDIDHSAHTKYGISEGSGTVAVLRPDGLLGFTAPLTGFGRVVAYLERLIVPQQEQKKASTNGHATRKELGELINEFENNLAMPVEDAENQESGVAAQVVA